MNKPEGRPSAMLRKALAPVIGTPLPAGASSAASAPDTASFTMASAGSAQVMYTAGRDRAPIVTFAAIASSAVTGMRSRPGVLMRAVAARAAVNAAQAFSKRNQALGDRGASRLRLAARTHPGCANLWPRQSSVLLRMPGAPFRILATGSLGRVRA